jgi:tetrapyrrole methylase family protein/MazG family protein
MAKAPLVLLRTARHPAAEPLVGPRVLALDAHYEQAASFEDAYAAIVEDVVAAALREGSVAYAVPGSPLVAERTVEMLRLDERVEVELIAGMSFLDLAWARLGLDPVTARVRLVDAERFALDAAGDTGPLLVCQTWSRAILSEVKLAVETFPDEPVTVLHHLGLADERVVEAAWEDLDRTEIAPDHLTCVWVPRLRAPVAAELVRLEQLVRVLRERCPWDREQTHASLARHLLEETYEALEAIRELNQASEEGPTGIPEAADHLEEELGDVLCQVFYHARLAEEEGLFNLADIARSTHDKLVARHPHVFGEAKAADAAEVLRRWERDKQAEKGRTSLTEGIPAALPSLALVAKLERKLQSAGLGMSTADRQGVGELLAFALGLLEGAFGQPGKDVAQALGAGLLGLARLGASSGVDPEQALAEAAGALVAHIRATEDLARASGSSLLDLDEAERRRLFESQGQLS